MFTYFGVFAPLSIGRSVAMEVLRSYDAAPFRRPVPSIQPSPPAQSINQKSAALARKRRPQDHQSENDMLRLNQVAEQKAGSCDKEINSGS
jgi:hypothetical protein